MNDDTLRRLILDQLGEKTKLRSLSGFKLDFSANLGFRKFFFSSSCECKTAALLSVEISESKTDKEIHNAIPALTERLKSQEQKFLNMDCTMHSMMKTGSYGKIGKQ
jgi:hypothetical protein